MIFIYACVFLVAFALAFLLTPLIRRFAVRFDVLDHPATPVKTHKVPVPYLGGVAIFVGVVGSLAIVRGLTHFPTGTLHALWGLLCGGFVILALGLIDDLKKPDGLTFYMKFLFQFAAAALLISFDIRIRFVQPVWLADVLTVLWVTGISNAINLIDIMDGLAASQSFVASTAFLLIAIPTEAVYVNVAAAAVAGASLAFLPHNFSKRHKIFMGDAGSLTLGFWLAGISLGTDYSRLNQVGVLAPVLILGLPVYDTFFVSCLRLLQGKSPFLGSRDHLAQKLRGLGLTGRQVVLVFAAAAAGLSAAAFFLTLTPFYVAVAVIGAVGLLGLFVMLKLYDVVAE